MQNNSILVQGLQFQGHCPIQSDLFLQAINNKLFQGSNEHDSTSFVSFSSSKSQFRPAFSNLIQLTSRSVTVSEKEMS